MHANPTPEHTEHFQLGHLTTQQYFAAAVHTLKVLRWEIVTANYPVIDCRTPGGDERITIMVADQTFTFRSKSVNEYYWVDNQNITNATLFKNTLANVVQQAIKTERNQKPMNRAKLGALVPSKAYLVTPVLIYLNTLVFIVMLAFGISVLTPETKDLLAWGGNFRPLVKQGDWWRLLTYMFVHAGVLHLLMNMYALLYIGMFLEPLLGKFRFVAAYVLTGVCAGLMSLAMHSFTVGVGASGAIFGMYGVFLAMLTTRHLEKTSRNTLLRSILFFVVLNLANGLKGNIDNAAHIGGLLSGIAIGYIYYAGLRAHQSITKQVLVNVVIGVVVAAVSVFTVRSLSDDATVYEQQMKRFRNIELMAMQAYKLDSSEPKAVVLRGLKDSGIHYWQEDLAIVQDMKKLDLPPQLQHRINLLQQYCNLQIDLYGLAYEDVQDDRGKNLERIKADNEKIAGVVREMRQ
jgi:rhomboid protease GluP